MQQAEYQGQKGWFDEKTQEFFPQDKWGVGTYGGKRGLISMDNKEFIPSEEASPYQQNVPTGIQKFIPEAIHNVGELAQALPMAGAVAGGVLTKGMPLAKRVASAALGSAAGQQATNFVESLSGERKWQGLGPELVQAGKDAVVGAEGEVLGQVGANVVNKVALKMAENAKNVYARAIHTPISGKWKTLYPGAEGTAREAAVEAGFKDKIPPNTFGLRSSQARVDALTQEVTNVAKASDHSIASRELAERGTTDVYGKAHLSSDSEAAGKAVGKVKQEVVEKGNKWTKPYGHLSAEDVLGLKRQFDAEIKWDQQTPVIDVKGHFTREARMGMRDAAMKFLEDTVPEIKSLNKKTQAYIDLKEALEHTIARDFNKDVVGATSKLLALKNIGLAVLDNFLGYNTNRARLAFAMSKATAHDQRIIARAMGYGTAKSGSQGNTVIQYDEQGNRVAK